MFSFPTTVCDIFTYCIVVVTKATSIHPIVGKCHIKKLESFLCEYIAIDSLGGWKYMHTYIYIHAHTQHTYTCTTHTCTHIYTQTYKHTYTHTTHIAHTIHIAHTTHTQATQTHTQHTYKDRHTHKLNYCRHGKIHWTKLLQFYPH